MDGKQQPASHPRRLSLRNRCPRCETGPIFSGFWMNDACPHCGYRFYREPGYFLGSMILSYFASSGLGIGVMLVLFVAYEVELVAAAITAVIAVAMVMPVFSRLARIAWIRIDHRVDDQVDRRGANDVSIGGDERTGE